MIETTRLAMPLLVAGQNNKEIHHNEALLIADLLLCPVVEGPPAITPPPSPQTGQCFVVGTGASGAWAGRDAAVAGWTEAGWVFVNAPEGSTFRIRASGNSLAKTADGWETGIVHGSEFRVGGVPVVKGQQDAIAGPTGGTNIDAQARTAIGSILAALRAHGLIAT